MKTNDTPPLISFRSHPFAGRLVGGVLAICALLLPIQRARADWASQNQLAPILNDFEDGNVPFGDGFPSIQAGTPGWNTAWTVGFSAGAAVVTNVDTASPLNGTANYLHMSWSNTASPVVVRRQYAAYFAAAGFSFPGTGSSTNLNTMDVGYIPMKISFDIRPDSFTGKVFTNQTTTNYITCTNGTLCTTSTVYADPPLNYTVTTNTTTTSVFAYSTNNWSSRNDNIFVQAATSAGTTAGNASSFVLYVQGAASRVQDPFGPANKWLVYEGNVASAASGSGQYIDTGMTFSFGTVYHVEIINDPRDKSYTVQIDNGTTTNRTGPVRWRCWSDLSQITARSFLHFGGNCNDSNSAMSLSIDTVSISHLPVSEFPPLISALRPSAIQPFTPKTNATSAGTGVPPLNFIPDYDTPEFWPASRGISFIASSAGGGSNDYSGGTYNYVGGLMTSGRTKVPTTGIGLVLNGVDVSGGLSISTPYGPNLRKVTYNGLQPNTFYTGMISVTNSAGAYKQAKIAFNTLDEDFVKVIEAEDYNYSDGSFSRSGVGSAPTVGGLYLDNPAPSDFTNNAYINKSIGYVDRMGMNTNVGPNVDYFVPNNNFGVGGPTNFNLANNLYRIADAVATTVALDFRRAKYNNSGAREFQVSNIQPGQWMNYTRTFAAGTYNFYLRGSSTQTGNSGYNAVNLDYVTSDPTQPGQTTTNIGVFLVTYTGNAQVFTNAPLINTNGGSILTVTLPAGVHTLRLTATNAGNNLQLNYLIAAPSSGSAPSVAITSPADGASFGSGATVTLQATATAGSTVTYYNGTTSLGSSASSPYTVNWTSVPTGRYSIIAKATSPSGFTAKSAPVNIAVGSPARKVLFVIGGKAGDNGAVDAGNAGTGDNAKRALFNSLGWSVTDMYATNLLFISGLAAANGFDMVAESVSVQASDVGPSFRDVPVPLWNEEPSAMIHHAVSKDNPSSVVYGASGGRAIFTLRPDAVGLPGSAGLPAGIYQTATALAAGNAVRTLNENARVILWSTNNNSGDSFAGFVWYYPAGSELFHGIVAPAVRYGWWNGVNDEMVSNPMTAVGTNLMVDGLKLTMSNPGYDGVEIYMFSPVFSGNNMTVQFRGASYENASDYSLWSSPIVNGVYTNDTTAVIAKPDPQWDFFQASTTTTGGPMFYRIRRNYTF